MARNIETRTFKARIFVVDDEILVRRGLGLFINGQPDLEVCGEAEGVVEAMAQIPALKPDLAIVDLALRNSYGLDLIRDLHKRCPDLKVLVFSMNNQASAAEAAFKAGAHGYVTKEEGTENILEAIRALLAGQPYVTASVAAKLPAALPRLK